MIYSDDEVAGMLCEGPSESYAFLSLKASYLTGYIFNNLARSHKITFCEREIVQDWSP
jgi:hypothetical protein